jgi:hypothetical protein
LPTTVSTVVPDMIRLQLNTPGSHGCQRCNDM